MSHIIQSNQIATNKQDRIDVNEVIAGDAARALALAADSQLGLLFLLKKDIFFFNFYSFLKLFSQS